MMQGGFFVSRPRSSGDPNERRVEVPPRCADAPLLVALVTEGPGAWSARSQRRGRAGSRRPPLGGVPPTLLDRVPRGAASGGGESFQAGSLKLGPERERYQSLAPESH